MPVTPPLEAFTAQVTIKEPDFISDITGVKFDHLTVKQSVDHGPIEKSDDSLFGQGFNNALGGALLAGIRGGQLAIIAGACCGLSLVYLLKFIWFLELVSYLIFINANFGSSLSAQHRTIYEWIHFDLIENVNRYIFRIRKYENSYFFKGKITEMELSGFLSTNAGIEFLPLLIVIGITSTMFAIKFFQKEAALTKKGTTENGAQVLPLIGGVNDFGLQKKHTWIDRLNLLRIGLILGSLIEYWLFVVTNLTKGLLFRENNFWEKTCVILSILLIMVFTEEVFLMFSMLLKLDFPPVKIKVTKENEEFLLKKL
jgi:hypothetical protein